MKKAITLFLSIIVLTFSLSLSVAADYPDISISDLETAIQNNAVILLDVNGTAYYEEGHIPSAINLRAHGEDIAQILGDKKDKLVVAYCGGPQCSAYKAGIKAAEAAGFTNIMHFSAGISGWVEAGKPVEKGSPKK